MRFPHGQSLANTMTTNNVDVVLTSHFLTQLYTRQSNFPNKRFFTHLPVLIQEGMDHLNYPCMIRFGDAKVIFTMKESNDSKNYRLVLVTVMPSHYKHNIVNKSMTIDVGSVK